MKETDASKSKEMKDFRDSTRDSTRDRSLFDPIGDPIRDRSLFCTIINKVYLDGRYRAN
jgi:hypothetical protein